MRLSSCSSIGWCRSAKTSPAMPHMSGRLPGRGHVAVEPLAHPELEADERPETRGIVAPPRVVRVQESSDGGGPEHPTLSRGPGEEDVPDQVPELTSEPLAERHPEAHLPARQDVPGERRRHGPLEDMLALPVPELQRRRNGRRVLHQDVVEQ